MTVKPDPDLPVNGQKNGSFVVAGHKLSPKEWAIFEYFNTCYNSRQTYEKFGFSKQYLFKLMKTSWWKQLELDSISMWQAEFESRYMQMDSRLLDGHAKVLDGGHDLASGTANAIEKAMESRLKVSTTKNIRAMLVPRADISVENKETIEFNININAEKIKKLSPVQIADWVKSGIMPTEMTELAQNAANEIIEAEFEDIEEDDDEGEPSNE